MRSSESQGSKYPESLKPGESHRGVAVDWRPVPRGRDREPGEVIDVQGVGGVIRSVFKDRTTRGLFDAQDGVKPGDLVAVECIGTAQETRQAQGWRSARQAPQQQPRSWGGRDGGALKDGAGQRAFKWQHWPLADVLKGPRPDWVTDELLDLALATAGIPADGHQGDQDGPPPAGDPPPEAGEAPAAGRGRRRSGN